MHPSLITLIDIERELEEYDLSDLHTRLSKIDGLIFLVRGVRQPKLVKQWKKVPKSYPLNPKAEKVQFRDKHVWLVCEAFLIKLFLKVFGSKSGNLFCPRNRVMQQLMLYLNFSQKEKTEKLLKRYVAIQIQ